MPYATATVTGLFILCAMVVALAFIGQGEIIPTAMVALGNLIVSFVTLLRVEQAKQTTEEVKDKVTENGKASP